MTTRALHEARAEPNEATFQSVAAHIEYEKARLEDWLSTLSIGVNSNLVDLDAKAIWERYKDG